MPHNNGAFFTRRVKVLLLDVKGVNLMDVPFVFGGDLLADFGGLEEVFELVDFSFDIAHKNVLFVDSAGTDGG